MSAALHNESLPEAEAAPAAAPIASEKKLSFDVKRLEIYLTRTLSNFRGPVVVSTPSAEHGSASHILSTPEGRFKIRHARLDDPENELIQLRKEFRILATLHRIGFPVAQPFLLCEEAHIADVPFYISSYPEGRVLTDAALLGMTREQRGAIYNIMNSTLARLHNYDPAALGLAPLAQSSSTLTSQIKRWEAVYTKNRLGEIEEMEQLAQWLPEYLPPERPSRILHGNYHLNRLIFHPTEPEIIAIRDWDNSSVGDPMADAVYHFLSWIIPPSDVSVGKGSLTGYNLTELGIPTLKNYMAAYAKSIKQPELPYLNFYFAYNLFRLSATMQSIATQTYTQDANTTHARLIASQVRPLAILGMRFAEKASLG